MLIDVVKFAFVWKYVSTYSFDVTVLSTAIALADMIAAAKPTNTSPFTLIFIFVPFCLSVSAALRRDFVRLCFRSVDTSSVFAFALSILRSSLLSLCRYFVRLRFRSVDTSFVFAFALSILRSSNLASPRLCCLLFSHFAKASRDLCFATGNYNNCLYISVAPSFFDRRFALSPFDFAKRLSKLSVFLFYVVIPHLMRYPFAPS